ncbi:MAG: MFS transporter [Promethearchaeota archaeon]
MMQKHNTNERIKYKELTPLWIGLTIDFLGFYIIIPFLPTFINVFNTTPLVIGFLLATNAIATAIFAPIWGKISDFIGRKSVLLISQAGTCTAFLILAFSNSIELLFLARIVDGIFGGNFPIVKAIITDITPPKDRGLQMTNVGVAHVLAGLVGPGLGGILSIIPIFGPQYPIATASLFAAGLSSLTIVITLFLIHESWPKSKRETFKKEIKIKIKLWQNKDASYLLTQYTFHSLAFIMYTTTLTIYLGIVLGLDILGISILLTISGISRVIVRFTLFKPTLKFLGEKRMTEIGLGIITVSFFLIGFVQDIWTFLVLMLFVSYGVSCSRGLLISKTTQSVKPSEMGKINGYTTAIDSIAQILGPIVGTFILTLYEPLWLGIIMGLFALIAFLMIFKQVTPFMMKMRQLETEKKY